MKPLQRILPRVGSLLLVVLVGTGMIPSARGQDYGLSKEEFQKLGKILPDLPGRIYEVRLLQGGQVVGLLVGGKKSGLEVFVFERTKERSFELAWKSGPIDSSLSVTSESEFHRVEYGLQLEGCASHLCPTDVFSVLLYVPSLRKGFTAKYVHGNITYSPETLRAENAVYRRWLDLQIKQRLDEWR